MNITQLETFEGNISEWLQRDAEKDLRRATVGLLAYRRAQDLLAQVEAVADPARKALEVHRADLADALAEIAEARRRLEVAELEYQEEGASIERAGALEAAREALANAKRGKAEPDRLEFAARQRVERYDSWQRALEAVPLPDLDPLRILADALSR